MADPRPEGSTQASASHYRGTAGARYFEYQRQIGELGGRLNRAKFEKHIDSSHTIVDFGCGGGGLLAGLDAQCKIGVEPSESARRAATRLGIACVASSAELESEIADVVISKRDRTHPFDELRHLRRALKRGGKLVLWLPIDDWRSERVVLVFEDMQWADESLLDFVEYLLEWSRNHPLHVVTLGPPGARRAPSHLGRGQAQLQLALPRATWFRAMQELLAGLVPGLPEELRQRILERAEGVPLYAVETVRMLPIGACSLRRARSIGRSGRSRRSKCQRRFMP